MKPRPPAAQFFDKVAVSKMVPKTIKRFQNSYWLSYMPFGAAVGLIGSLCSIVVIKSLIPRPKLLIEDPLFAVNHNGVNSPSINHMDHILRVCDGDDGGLMENFRRHGVSLWAPPSSMIPLPTRPSMDQIEEASELV